MKNTKQQQDAIDILYWISDVMTAGDERYLSEEQLKLINDLDGLLELDPKYKYIIEGNIIRKDI